MLRDQLCLETDNGVGVRDDGLRVVLRLVAWSAWCHTLHMTNVPSPEVDQLVEPSRRYAAIRDEALGVADLVGLRLANGKVRVVGGQVVLLVGFKQRLLMHASWLGCLSSVIIMVTDGFSAFCMMHVVQFRIVEAEHVHVQRDGDARKHVLQNVVNVVTTDVEQVYILAGRMVE